MTVAELNALDSLAAADVFAACLAAPAWVDGMVAARPFSSRDDVLGAAESAADGIAPDEWRETIAHHPRIGESRAATTTSARAIEWSAGEQSGALAAADPTPRAEVHRL